MALTHLFVGTALALLFLSGSGTCNANAAARDTRLQVALDYACGNGAEPLTVAPSRPVVDASIPTPRSFNDYYQRNGRSDQSCDFGGCGSLVHQQPKVGNCVLPPRA